MAIPKGERVLLVDHAFGDDAQGKPMKHRHDARDVAGTVWVGGNTVNHRSIELHVVQPRLIEAIDASQLRSGMLQPDTHAFGTQLPAELLRMIRNTHSTNRGKMSLMRHTRTSRSAPHQWMRAMLMKHLTSSAELVKPPPSEGSLLSD